MSNGSDRAALQQSGADADSDFGTEEAGGSAVDCESHCGIEIELLDENGDPIADAAYEIELADGNVLEGNLDENGFMREEEIPEGTCHVKFPGLEPPPLEENDAADDDAAGA